jgi:plastocyanin
MNWLTEERCAGISLAQDRAEPLDPVALDGWPDPAPGDHGTVVARILVGDGEVEDAPIVVVPDWHDPVAIPTPVHPDDALNGGPLALQVGQMDGEDLRWCADVLDLEVAPLPPAGPEHGIREQLDHLDVLLELMLEPEAVAPLTLATWDRDDVPLELVPAYVLAVLLHDEDGLHAAVSEMTDDEVELADRLTASIQRPAAEGLPSEVALVDDSDVSSDASSDDGEDHEAAADPALAAPAAAPARALPTSVRSIRARATWPDRTDAAPTVQPVGGGEECTVTSFAGLTDLLGEQISGDTMAGGSTGFAIDAAMFVGGLPVIGRVGLPTVLTAWATKFAAEYLQGTRPSRWERTDFEHSPESLWEDDVDGGYVDAIAMRFSSTGWDFGPMLAELAIILSGVVGTSVLTRHLRKPRAGDPGVIEFWGDVVYDSMASMDAAGAEAELVAEVVGWIATEVIGQFVDLAGVADDLRVFHPECWEARTERPNLDDSVRLDYLDAIEQGSADEHFLAVQTGSGTIEGRWELPIGGSILGVGLSQDVRDATASFGASGDVEVSRLDIAWEPSRRQVEPGEKVELRVEVSGAHDGRVRVTDSLGQVDEELDARGGATLTYSVPSDWDGTSIAVVATSLTAAGLRDPSHPGYRGELDGTAWLVDEDDGMYLEPQVSCVEEGQTVQFEVTDTPLGGDLVDVTWSADGGSMGENGSFTAPSRAGEVTVTATSVDDPDRQVSRTLTVGPCDVCSWEVTIDGDLYDHSNVSASGDTITLRDVDWETGAFGSIEFGLGQVVLVNDPPTASTSSQRPMQVAHYPWHTRSIWEGRFVPDERPKPFQELLQQSEAEVPGWEVPPVQANLDHAWTMIDGAIHRRIEIEPHPVITLEGRIDGPVVVGRRATDTIDGQQRAMTQGLVAEPVFGTISIQLEGLFRPWFLDSSHDDVDLDALSETPPGEWPDGLPAFRTYDTDRTDAWCGGPMVTKHERWLDGSASDSSSSGS